MDPDSKQPESPGRSEEVTVVSDLEATVKAAWEDVADLATTMCATLKCSVPQDSEAATLVSGAQPAARPAEASERLGDFQIVSVIGEGGMGVVYTARQTSLDREVALKMLKGPGQSAGDKVQDAFTAEAVVTGDLDHPNIVPVHTLEQDALGKVFYTMKKVRGKAWEDVLDGMDLDENLEILLRVSDAVAFAHSRGVIHRDLKPENVMVGDFGEVLVMDWGLAVPVDPESKMRVHGGEPGFGGTPAYMAPEMATSKPDGLGRRSDVYLLGGILYRIVTGLTPHTADSPFQCIMAAARNEIRPTDKKGELVDIALKAMSARTEDRHQSVGEFQEAIRGYREHAQSMKLVEESREFLDAARAQQDYDSFARAMFGFEAALTLWEENDEARDALQLTKAEYAENAYEKGDFDLALSLLDEGVGEHDALRQRILAAKSERLRRRKHMRRLRNSALALAGLLIGSLTVGFFWIRAERNETLRQSYFTSVGLAAKKIEDLRFDTAAELLDDCTRRLRHWEWGRLNYLCHMALATFPRHAAQVQAIAFSPDGQWIASGDAAGTIEIWSPDSVRSKETLTAHEGPVTSLAFSPDGALLASAGEDGAVKLWDAATGKQAADPLLHDDAVLCVAFSPDGRTIATGGNDCTLRTWDVEGGTEVLQSTGHAGPVGAVAFSPDGRCLAWGIGELGQTGTVGLLDLETGVPIVEVNAHTDGVNCVAFSPAGDQMASTSWDAMVRLWAVPSGRLLGTLTGHSGAVYAAAYDSTGMWLVSCGDDSTIRQWDLAQLKETRLFRGHSGAVFDVAVSPDGVLVASASMDGTARLWDVQHSRPETLVLAGHKGAVTSIGFASDGVQLVSGSQDGTIKIWNLEDATETAAFGAGQETVTSVDFSPDDTLVGSGNWDGTVTIWDAASGEAIDVLEGHLEPVRSVEFSPDGSLIASGSWDNHVRTWDVASATPMGFLEGHTAPVQCVAFSPDGRRLASCGRDKTVRVWDVQTSEELHVLSGHDGWVRAVTYSPDGRLIASAGDDNVVKLWDTETAQCVATLKGHTNFVKSVAFSPDALRLVSGGDDAVARIWAVDTAQEVLSLSEHGVWIWSVAFSPDGRLVASGSGDGTVRVWEATDWRE